ncbi:hypothetical protein A2U01_0119277, partial [Trifolium medium]|nr:hypothetical protein [Trifolium medium]
MISVGTVGIRGDEDGGIILPDAGNEDENGKYFRWWSWSKE